MRCISRDGVVRRVSNEQASKEVAAGAMYVSRSVWKNAGRTGHEVPVQPQRVRPDVVKVAKAKVKVEKEEIPGEVKKVVDNVAESVLQAIRQSEPPKDDRRELKKKRIRTDS